MSTNNTRQIPSYPGTLLRRGSQGASVQFMQYCLDSIRENLYGSINRIAVDGIFGRATETAVMQYQAIKNLKIDGIIGPDTWNSIVDDYSSIPDSQRDVYPGSPLSWGSSGASVLVMQNRLNAISPVYPAIAVQNADGKFGVHMSDAVRLFQKQFELNPDGVIGEKTWDSIIQVSNGVTAGVHEQVHTRYSGLVTAGSTGDSVRFVQAYMNRVGVAHQAGFPAVKVDGIYGPNTRALIIAFQTHFGLKADGIVGSNTWSRMIDEFNQIV